MSQHKSSLPSQTPADLDFDSQDPRVRARVSRALRTNWGMAAFLNHRAGPGQWVHDPATDTWIVADVWAASEPTWYTDRHFIEVRRGGWWRRLTVPAGVVS